MRIATRAPGVAGAQYRLAGESDFRPTKKKGRNRFRPSSVIAEKSRLLLRRAPACGIRLASDAAERNRRHTNLHVELLVPLDRHLPGAAVGLAPHQRQDFVLLH